MIFSVNNSNNRFTLRLTLTEGAYSVANNSSPVTYKLELIANTAYNFTQYRMASAVVLGGVTVHSQAKSWDKQYSIDDYGTLVIASGTATFTHDTDGKKSLSVAYSIDMDAESYTPGSLSGTGKMELAQIPRQATLTSAPNFTDEENPTITYSNPAGSAVSSIAACISLDTTKDDIAYRAIPTSGTSYTFRLTDAERAVLRNATTTSTTRSVYFYVRTVIGGVTYHSSVEKTLSIVNANPTYTNDQLTYADMDSNVVEITGNNQTMVQNQSYFAVGTGKATGKKGASIVQYNIELNDVTREVDRSGTYTMGVINSSKDVDLIVTAVDSRGNTTTAKKTIPIIAWSAPTFTVALERLNNYEDETYLTVDASIASIDSKNVMTITYKVKEDGGSYGIDNPINNKEKYTLNFDKNKAYVLSVTVADLFDSTTKEFPLAKGKFPLFIDTEKAAVGINEFPKSGEALRVAGGNAVFEGAINGIYFSKARVWGVKSFTLQTRWSAFDGDGNSRQSIFIFGYDDSKFVQGIIGVNSKGGTAWSGTDGVVVSLSTTDGAINVTLPYVAYDEFILISAYPTTVL